MLCGRPHAHHCAVDNEPHDSQAGTDPGSRLLGSRASPVFMLADVAENARRKTQGKTSAPISPIALEAVRRINALFEIERTINGQTADHGPAVAAGVVCRPLGGFPRALTAPRAATRVRHKLKYLSNFK